jgi:hypothetical protein
MGQEFNVSYSQVRRNSKDVMEWADACPSNSVRSFDVVGVKDVYHLSYHILHGKYVESILLADETSRQHITRMLSPILLTDYELEVLGQGKRFFSVLLMDRSQTRSCTNTGLRQMKMLPLRQV